MSSHSDTFAAAGPSQLRTVFGVWRKSAPPPIPDAVDVMMPVVEVAPSSSPYNSLDDFFGALEGQRPRPCATVSAPPPYTPSINKESGSCVVEEPPTLARLLFKYGFFFFPFWIGGIYILYSPLLPTPDWEAGKTEAVKAQLTYSLRETEKKWARRCLCAMFSLTVAIFLLVIIIQYGIIGII